MIILVTTKGGDTMEEKTCCICGCTIEGYGNNPDGAPNYEYKPELQQLCCDACNLKYVIPGRMKRMWSIRQEFHKEDE